MKRGSTDLRLPGLLLALGVLALPLPARGADAVPAGDTRPAINPALLRLITPVTAASAPRSARISNVRVTEIGTGSAVLEWETDTPVTEEVYYGYFPTQELPMLVLQSGTTHRVTLGNLLRGTEHHYRIVGREDVTGTFVTAGPPPPLYERKDLEFVDARTVKLTWRTSVPTLSTIGYRLATVPEWTTISADPRPAWDHAFLLNGLRPETKYFCIIESVDSSGYTINTGERWFVTPEDNVALRQPVTGTFCAYPGDSSVIRDSDPLRRVTDGDLDYFTGMATSGDLTADSQWVTVDLGREYPLDRIVTVWRKLAYPRAFKLDASRDGESWTPVAALLDAGRGTESYTGRGTPALTLTTPARGITGRYVRLTIPRGSPFYSKHRTWRFVQLLELKAIPREETRSE